MPQVVQSYDTSELTLNPELTAAQQSKRQPRSMHPLSDHRRHNEKDSKLLLTEMGIGQCCMMQSVGCELSEQIDVGLALTV